MSIGVGRKYKSTRLSCQYSAQFNCNQSQLVMQYLLWVQWALYCIISGYCSVWWCNTMHNGCARLCTWLRWCMVMYHGWCYWPTASESYYASLRLCTTAAHSALPFMEQPSGHCTSSEFVLLCTVAQTTVPMFACFALNSILCDKTLTPSKSMSVWNKVLTHGFLAIQESEDLVKIWLNGSHTKMATHWDSFLTFDFYYIY